MERRKATGIGTDPTAILSPYGMDGLDDKAAVQALSESLNVGHLLVHQVDVSYESSHRKTTNDRLVLAFT